MIKWLFFDLGSTLIDENDCIAIFKLALEKTKCAPNDACMIGDRLDNDIEPAAQIGMHTIWVRQGVFAGGNLELIQHKPEYTVNSVADVLKYF